MDLINYQAVQKAIVDRIGAEHLGANVTVTNNGSPYNRRQASGDGISRGTVVAEDMVKLSQCQSLDMPTPYEYSALALRRQHVDVFNQRQYG